MGPKTRSQQRGFPKQPSDAGQGSAITISLRVPRIAGSASRTVPAWLYCGQLSMVVVQRPEPELLHLVQAAAHGLHADGAGRAAQAFGTLDGAGGAGSDLVLGDGGHALEEVLGHELVAPVDALVAQQIPKHHAAPGGARSAEHT